MQNEKIDDASFIKRSLHIETFVFLYKNLNNIAKGNANKKSFNNK